MCNKKTKIWNKIFVSYPKQWQMVFQKRLSSNGYKSNWNIIVHKKIITHFIAKNGEVICGWHRNRAQTTFVCVSDMRKYILFNFSLILAEPVKAKNTLLMHIYYIYAKIWKNTTMVVRGRRKPPNLVPPTLFLQLVP